MLLLKRKTTRVMSITQLLSNPDSLYFALFSETEPGIRAFLSSFDKPVVLMSLNMKGPNEKFISDYFHDTTDTIFVLPLLSLESELMLPTLKFEQSENSFIRIKRKSLCKYLHVTDVYTYFRSSMHNLTLQRQLFSLSDYLTKYDYGLVSGDLLSQLVTYREFCERLYRSPVVCHHEYAGRRKLRGH